MGDYLVRYPISGTRNGEPWPDRGERIELPDAEALDYLNAGYITPAPIEGPATAAISDPVGAETGKARAPRPAVKAAEKAEAAAKKAAEDLAATAAADALAAEQAAKDAAATAANGGPADAGKE
ncbi:hypothetical protein [Cellulomonas timonensis]|uniref:hypothetical protein n=1 Tax=Cellulomonas timonensis TaxID=1689271 RepID=UPI0008317F6A|nr:hypothetical protein [Cellulomonas timonensis]